MIERFAAHTRSCDEHLQVLHNLILPGKRFEASGAQGALVVAVALNGAVVYVEILLFHCESEKWCIASAHARYKVSIFSVNYPYGSKTGCSKIPIFGSAVKIC